MRSLPPTKTRSKPTETAISHATFLAWLLKSGYLQNLKYDNIEIHEEDAMNELAKVLVKVIDEYEEALKDSSQPLA